MAERKPKKKLIEVKPLKRDEGNTSPYGMAAFHFAFVCAPPERRQVTHSQTCREAMANDAYAAIRGGHRSSVETEFPVDFSKLRLLVVKSCSNTSQIKDFKTKLFSGKRAMNIYENVGKFSGRSTITTVNHSFYSKDSAFLITGPKEWMVSGQMLSMAGLILRICGTDIGPIQGENLKELEAYWKKHCTSSNSGDRGYIYNCWKAMRVLAKYNEKIFGTDPKKNFVPLKGGGAHFGINSGLWSLVKHDSHLPHIQSKFEECMKKEWK